MASPRPTAKQLAWQDLETGLFVHFGVNTYADQEWTDGTVEPARFNPVELDARQWARAARAAGFRYLVVTAKHHDGFCLWPTETTDYCVKSSPWRDGHGDVLEEVAAACAAEGLKLGFYCSPWDRHEPCYADAAAYDRFYVQQWTELLTRYGPVAEVWFDGAGSQDHHFDWPRIYDTVYALQPEAVCFNGVDVRWVGNEDGLAPDPCWNVVEYSGAWPTSRQAAEMVYRPAECDVPLRKGWFWHPDPDGQTRKPLPKLWDIYHRSVGHGANLLMNIGPDPSGLIPEADAAAIAELRRTLDRAYGVDLATGASVAASSAQDAAGRVADGDRTTAWQADAGTAWVELRLPEPREIDRAVVEESLAGGERIKGWRLLVDGAQVASGESIGHKKIARFAPVRATTVRLTVDQADEPPALRTIQLYRGEDPGPV